MPMTLVSTVTVGAGGASSITFSNIPQTGLDLYVAISGRGSTAGNTFSLRTRLNGLTSTYQTRYLEGSGSGSTNGGSFSLGYIGEAYVVPGANQVANIFGSTELYISNYTGVTNKMISINGVLEGNSTSTSNGIYSGYLNLTNSVTSISLFLDSGSWVQNTSASLYIISA